MKKMISVAGVLCALVGSAYAASATVMSFEGGEYVKGEIAPLGWYPYKTPEKGNTASIDTATAKTYKYIEAMVSKTTESSAGVSLNWKANDKAIDLSAYKGICLTYSASTAFRLDFKQSTVTDYNYHGVVVPKQTVIDTLFIAFDGAKQEDWGDDTIEKKFDASKQTGLQFGYKTALAKESGVTTAVIKVAAMTLGSSCSNHAPNLKTGVEADDVATLPEGDTLKVAFSDIFEDADDDALNIEMTIPTTGEVVDLKNKESYSLGDTAWIKSMQNPEDGTTAKISFKASDAAGSVTYNLTAKLVNRDNAPVATDDNYTVDEDSELTITSILKGLLANDFDDDGDGFEITAYTQPENGEVVVNKTTGTFTYTPNADFHGVDTFTYTITDEITELSSEGKVTITVNNVDDPASLVIKDSTIYVGDVVDDAAINFADGIAVDEDFAEFNLFVPIANLSFVDPDAPSATLAVSAKSKSGRVNVEYAKLGANHVMTVSAVPDANGKDAIRLFAVSGKDTLAVEIPITIAALPDPPKAVADTFDVVQDSLNSIPAAKGLLVNDVNPDGKSVLLAFLATPAEHGTVVVDTTGAFTYEVSDFEGEDSFTYTIKNADGEESEPVKVVLNVEYKNKAPAIVAGVADTVGTRVAALKEDFATSVVYKGTEVKTWFEDPDGPTAKLTFTVENPDSLVSVTINATAAITIKAVKEACGETFINVVATDSLKATTALKIPINVACVNDKPMRIGGATDTILVPAAGWRLAFGAFDLFEDPDDTVLVMKVTETHKMLNPVIEDDSLVVSLSDETQYLQNHVPYVMKVSATDESGASSIAKTLVFMLDVNAGIPQVAGSVKAGWQSAILADRGVAAMCDMQGRVMWKHRLPVSEDAVRNAAAKVQGRKILMVNKQTWTIR